MTTIPYLLSTPKSDVLDKKRDTGKLDTIIERGFKNLSSLDNLFISDYDKRKFEEIIFDFVKNEQLMYITLNSKNHRTVKDINDLINLNNDLEIIYKFIQDYTEECSLKFEKMLNKSIYRGFLIKLSEKIVGFIDTPNGESKKNLFDIALKEMNTGMDEEDYNLFIKKLNTHREMI